jgi:replicative DNA helicase
MEAGRVATGFPSLDATLLGGLGPGELGIIVAPWGGGKTALLVNLGAAACLNGKRVFHLTLELGRTPLLHRYDLRFSGCTREELRRTPSLVRRTRGLVGEAGGELWVRDSSHERVTPSRVERMIERLPKKPDVVLVDYAGEMKADQVYGGDAGRRSELGEVARELRRIAAFFGLPIWTAAQAQRGTSLTGNFSLDNTAEDIGQIRVCDVGLCFLQNERMYREGRGILQVGKLRNGFQPEKEIPLGVDFRRMLITEVTHGNP